MSEHPAPADVPVPASPWSEMDLREFHESGLLWHVNRAVLWPLGLALALERDTTTGEYRRLFVTRLDPYEAITSGDTPGEEAGRVDRLMAWMKARLSAR